MASSEAFYLRWVMHLAADFLVAFVAGGDVRDVHFALQLLRKAEKR